MVATRGKLSVCVATGGDMGPLGSVLALLTSCLTLS